MKNYNLLFFVVAISALLSCSSSEDYGDDTKTNSWDDITFTVEHGVYQDVSLPYRKALIGNGASGKYALVIYLHGGSSKGNDNSLQLSEQGINSISRYLSKNQIKTVMLVPQCPADKSWGGVMNAVLKALIDEYCKSGTVDEKRIYIFGGSMGGTGVWSMASSYPHLFAAVMPVAGNPSKCDAANVATTSVYTVMGTADRIMNVDNVTNFVSQVKSSGGDVKFDTEEGWTHETTCTESYTTERLNWVFSKVSK